MLFKELKHTLLTNQSADPLHEKLNFNCPKLNDFFDGLYLKSSLSEWGTPKGQLGRIVPALVVKAMQGKILWVTDEQDAHFYPHFWSGLGVSLKSIFFLKDDNPIKNLRQALRSGSFNIVVLDIEAFVSTSDIVFLARLAKERSFSCFLLRNYFLSARNGNPFCKHRFNCSYLFKKNQVNLKLVKGIPRKPVNLSFSEILNG